jgi:spore maturation protein CgeB
MSSGLKIVILGLSITSSWGNGHATTYRALVRELERRGHDLLFLERDQPCYAQNRDLPRPPYGRTRLYDSLDELRDSFAAPVRDADLVIVGSFVPDGAAVGDWVQRQAGGIKAFYDIDTPVTLAKLAAGDDEYVSPAVIPAYGLYLSFTGGPSLATLERRYGARAARALYCSVDAETYRPLDVPPRWDLSYLGTYSADRQPTLDRLLVEVARQAPELRFCVAGPQYPDGIDWPANVQRMDHVPPADHPAFYAASRFTLNVTRADMIAAGYSPSVRLFEAAACGAPIVSDAWEGLDELFAPGREILLAEDAAAVLHALRETPEAQRRALGEAGRRRILAAHTAGHRAAELEALLCAAEPPPAAAADPDRLLANPVT